MRIHIGLDIHRNETVYVAKDEAGRVIGQGNGIPSICGCLLFLIRPIVGRSACLIPERFPPRAANSASE
jgi:hypothetical protein